MGESWVYLYDPETKEMSKTWKHASSPTPKKTKMQHSSIDQGSVFNFVRRDTHSTSLGSDHNSPRPTYVGPSTVSIGGSYYYNLIPVDLEVAFHSMKSFNYFTTTLNILQHRLGLSKNRRLIGLQRFPGILLDHEFAGLYEVRQFNSRK